ncbi:hypothetical protein SAMN05421642_103236 [Rhodococcoides kyotonense]|uniref:Uncharacterized protein n=1 Tax=Rhodococcoides kyotonense TaxID=398843 RepID=A0A239FDG3_9NOCA|nr:hypothetical protein SAMN05421642_103236 [Rhodococcus kyotonensis]
MASAIQAHARGKNVVPFPPDRRHEFELAAVRVAAVLAGSANVAAEFVDRLGISAEPDLMECVFDITDQIVQHADTECVPIDDIFIETATQFAFRDVAKNEESTR